jgi:DNA mismatch repair ATPase MutL
VIEESIRAALIKSSPVLNIKTGVHDSSAREVFKDRQQPASREAGFSAYLSEGLTGIDQQAKEKQAAEKTGSQDVSYLDSSYSVSAETRIDQAGIESGKKKVADVPHPSYTHVRRREPVPDRSIEGLETDSRLIPNLKETEIRVIGQLLNSFILAQGGEDLLIIDQHIAHERIRYEQLKEQFASKKIESQNLLLPETFEVTREDDITLRELAGNLIPLGFQIEPFGGRTWAVKAIPVETDASGESIVREMLDLFEDIKSSGSEGDLKERLTEEMIALIACHGSIKKNMFLTKDKMEWLLSQLALCKEPYRCPHGRPVILRIERNELFKKFGRDIH